MAELPLLFFPKATTESPAIRGGGGAKINKPSAAEQKARLDQKFQTIANSFKDLKASADGLEPEQVVVLETIGTIEGFAQAASQIPGLEWLTELELEECAPGDGFTNQKKPAETLPRRLYAVMSNQQAIDQLIGLWKDWHRNPEDRAKPKFGPFKNIFIHLKDVRRWDVQDRITDTRIVEYWEGLQYETGKIRFEVELWCRSDSGRRAVAYQNLRQIITSAGGQCISWALIPEILYYGVLADLPAARVKETIAKINDKSYTQLLRCEDVMFFRPHAQSAFPGREPDEEDKGAPAGPKKRKKPMLKGAPVIALLDGLPLEHHDMLDGRLDVQDPDDHASRYAPRQQQHGTAMASLIHHGDLSTPGDPLPRLVHVRPIMVPYEDLNQNVEERTPDDKLLVDIIHSAVVGIMGAEEMEGTAPTVKVINLSIGNCWQPFCRDLSPLARLLDWLAWKYKILFVVSVGNQSQTIKPAFATASLAALSDNDVCARTLEAMYADQMNRRPFSPAEAMNVVTVGALHADGSTWAGLDQRVDLIRYDGLPSPLGTVASGYNRSVKPDILFPGGRQLYHQVGLQSQAPPYFSIARSSKVPGLCVAAPGEFPMELGRTVYSRGTSNATALATRTVGLIYERLLELRNEPEGDRLTDEYVSVILKALLVHGASWGEAADLLQNVFGATVTDWREMLRLKARFLGYGKVDPKRALSSENKRVLMLGWDTLTCGQAHDYSVPLPPSLSGKKVKRRLTVTLAWLSPLNSRHKDYRKALLWISPEKDKLALDKKDLDAESSRRGTIQHMIFEGEKVRAFSDGEKLIVKVSCAEEAGRLVESIPYAVAVTLEIADPIDLKIFNEVKDRIRLKVGVRPKTG